MCKSPTPTYYASTHTHTSIFFRHLNLTFTRLLLPLSLGFTARCSAHTESWLSPHTTTGETTLSLLLRLTIHTTTTTTTTTTTATATCIVTFSLTASENWRVLATLEALLVLLLKIRATIQICSLGRKNANANIIIEI